MTPIDRGSSLDGRRKFDAAEAITFVKTQEIALTISHRRSSLADVHVRVISSPHFTEPRFHENAAFYLEHVSKRSTPWTVIIDHHLLPS